MLFREELISLVRNFYGSPRQSTPKNNQKGHHKIIFSNFGLIKLLLGATDVQYYEIIFE